MELFRSEETTVSGVAREVRWREAESPSRLSFRVERTDDTGNVTGYTQVQTTAIEVEDLITEGDQVTVSGTTTDGGILEVSSVENETTEVTYSPDSGELGGLIVLGPPLGGAIVGAIGGAIGVVPGSAQAGLVNAALESAISGLLVGGLVTIAIVLGLVIWGAVSWST